MILSLEQFLSTCWQRQIASRQLELPRSCRLVPQETGRSAVCVLLRRTSAAKAAGGRLGRDCRADSGDVPDHGRPAPATRRGWTTTGSARILTRVAAKAPSGPAVRVDRRALSEAACRKRSSAAGPTMGVLNSLSSFAVVAQPPPLASCRRSVRGLGFLRRGSHGELDTDSRKFVR